MRLWLLMSLIIIHATGVLVGAQVPDSSGSASPDLSKASRFGERFDAFLLLWQDRQANLRKWDELVSQPGPNFADWTLLLLGDVPRWADLGIDPSSFIRGGGKLLVASDRSTSLPLGPSLQILHGPIRSSREESSYKGNAACPLVTEFRREHPVMSGIEQIALNLPGVFAGGDSAAWGIAYLPRTLDVRLRSRVWLVGGELDQGRFIASADASIFTNEMIQEADNARLADNIVSWLSANSKGKAGNVVCLIHGREVGSLIDERFINGNWVNHQPTKEILNELLRGLQEEDVPNAILREAQTSLNESSPWIVRQLGIIIIGSVMGAMLAWRILGARDAREPIVPPTASQEGWVPALDRSATAALPRADRILETRHKETLIIRDFRQQLRQQAVRCLDGWFGPGQWRQATHGPWPPAESIPPVHWWKRRQITQSLRGLRRLASDSAAEHVHERKFRFWKSRIDWLDTIIRDEPTLRS
jgi:hypothetical protein